MDGDDIQMVYGNSMMKRGNGGHHILSGNAEICNMWMATLLVHSEFPTPQGFTVVQATANMSCLAHHMEDPSQLAEDDEKGLVCFMPNTSQVT